MHMDRFSLSLLTILLVVVACGGSDDDSDVSGLEEDEDAKKTDNYLSDTALDQLEDVNAYEFLDKAVVKSVEEREDATKVTFEPDSGPICMRGDDFWTFYVDRGSDKTLFMLDGGGACWTGFCMSTEVAADAIMPLGPASSDPSNYFSDWNIISVPYCDGSVFSGANEVTEPDGSIRYHHGRQNLAASIDQALEHFGDSTQVMIAGFSAGSYGTITGMVAVRLAFPEADLFVVADSGLGLQNPANAEATSIRIEEWGFDETIPAGCEECDGGHGQLSAMYQWMLENDSNVKISILSYYGDTVIGQIFNGMPEDQYKALLLSETDPIHDEYPDRFKRFMLPGAGHVLSMQWSTLTVDDVTVGDWVTAMATGDDLVWRDILGN